MVGVRPATGGQKGPEARSRRHEPALEPAGRRREAGAGPREPHLERPEVHRSGFRHRHTSAADGEVQIAVEDTGIGIEPKNLSHIFERFNQGDGSVTRRFGGTGIGLAYAREIVELHGGHVTVESTPGKGSRFVVHLKEGADESRSSFATDAPAATRQADLKRQDDQEPREWGQRLQRQNEYRFAEIGDATDRRVISRGAASNLGPASSSSRTTSRSSNW